MAFGFLGDIVEEIGEIVLPRGTRGATIGGALGGPVGAVAGAVTSQALSQATGKSAVTTPTVAQAAGLAPETPMSGATDGFPGVYRPQFGTYTAGFTPRLPAPTTGGAMGAGAILGEVMDFIPDISISKYFGGDLATCGTRTKQLFSVRDTKNGQCLSVTRKQQHQLKQMVMYMGINETAAYVGLSVPELASLLVKKFPPRRKGISAAQLRNAKRVNRTIMGMAKQLTDSCKTTTRRR
jgi:hypothetical protein